MLRKLCVTLALVATALMCFNASTFSDTARDVARNSTTLRANTALADTLPARADLPSFSSAHVGITDVVMRATATPKRYVAMRWAESQRGKPYLYGGSGPGSYDCSGLVMRAYQHAGIYLPRTTQDMLGSYKLHRTTHPVWGDLAFFGSGHVELYVGGGRYSGTTFGAHHSGTLISFRGYNSYWHPTVFMHVINAG